MPLQVSAPIVVREWTTDPAAEAAADAAVPAAPTREVTVVSESVRRHVPLTALPELGPGRPSRASATRLLTKMAHPK